MMEYQGRQKTRPIKGTFEKNAGVLFGQGGSGGGCIHSSYAGKLDWRSVSEGGRSEAELRGLYGAKK